MIAKEKAEELVAKYCELFGKHHRYIGIQQARPIEAKHHAIQAAIIAVDELINLATNDHVTIGHNTMTDKEYWWEIKQELEKMQNQ